MVDARGLLCPMPVVMVKKEVNANAPANLTVLVDDPCAVENIDRFAFHAGYDFSAADKDGEWELTLTKK